MGERARFGGVLIALGVALATVGCSDDDPFDDGAFTEIDDARASADDESSPQDGGTDTATTGAVDEVDLIVTVEGTEYLVDTERGGYCEVGDTEAGTNLAAGGFDEASGTRVELALRYQVAETTPSGVDEYYGGLSLASGDTSWDTSSQEPWPFALADATAGSVMMVNADGQSVEVAFELDCP